MSDELICASLRKTGIWDSTLTDFYDHQFQMAVAAGPANIFVDAGANTGYFSMAAASYGIRVVAFEPIHHNLVTLNKKINGFNDLITVRGCALTNKTGLSLM